MRVLYLVLGIIVVLIAISFLFDFNIGALSVLAALIVGKVFLGYSNSVIVGMVPASTILTMIILSAFYGFALENGTAGALIQSMISRFGRRSALLPVGIFALTAALSGIGLGSGNATVIMAPIALAIAAEAGFDPLSMAMAVGCGAAVGSNFPFSFGGSIAVTLIQESGSMQDATPAIMDAALRNTVVQTLSFLIVFAVRRGYRNAGMARQKPPAMNGSQKKNAVLIGVVALCSVIPPVLKMVVQTEFTVALANYCDINTVMLLGVIVAKLLDLADEREVVKNHVPWMLIIVISGMSMLIGIARQNGIVEWLGQMLSRGFPVGSIKYVVILIAMAMSLFGGAISIVLPTLYPMVPGIAASTGLNIGMLYGAVLVGATCGGLSPYSSGGMILMSAYPDTSHRRKFMLELLCMPVVQTLISMLVYII